MNKSSALIYEQKVLTRPLSRISAFLTDKALRFNELLNKIQDRVGTQESQDKNKHRFYRLIQDLFEQLIIKNGNLISSELADEFYLQLYR